MELAAVLLNYGDPTHTIRALDSLASVDGSAPSLIVVVDNGSAEPHLEGLRAELGRHSTAFLLALPENLGFGGGMNAGAAHAFSLRSDAVILLNNDVMFSDAWLDNLLHGWEQTSIRSPVIRDALGGWWWTGGALDPKLGRVIGERDAPPHHLPLMASTTVSGCALLASRDVWTRLGGFYEPYFMYWEDRDLSHRACQLGVPIEVVTSSEIIHTGAGTTGNGNGWPSPRMYYFAARNRWLFIRRAKPGALWAIVNVMLIIPRARALWKSARGQGINPTPYMREYLLGTLAGLRGEPDVRRSRIIPPA